MPTRYLSIGGFVLAGGASRRMGHAKPGLVLGSETLLVRQIRLLRAVCRSVTVLGRTEDFPGLEVPVWADIEAGRGPLAGLATGLAFTPHEFNLFLGCDLPFLQERFLRWLCARSLEYHADATVPESREGYLQSLCAVYRRRALPVVRATLARGENKVRGYLRRTRKQVVYWPEIARAGFSPRIFDNLNTPQDYEAARTMVNSEL